MPIFRPIPSKVRASVDDVAVNEKLKDLEHHLKSNQFNNARATLSAIRTQMPGVKDYNIELLNTMTSIEEGLASGDLSLTASRRELREAFELYTSHIQKVLDTLRVPTQEEEKQAIDDLSGLAKEHLLSFESHRSAILERLKGKGVVLTTAPVLTITAPYLDVDKLNRNGFKAKSLEGYPVLHGQTVVGISIDTVLSRLTGERLDKLKPAARAKRRQELLNLTKSLHRDEVRDEILETVFQRFRSQKLIQVGKDMHYENAAWYWLVPADHLKLWKSCTSSPTTVNSLSIKDWGFPFAAR